MGDSPMSVAAFLYDRNGDGKPTGVVKVRTTEGRSEHEVEVYVSPTGRSVRVWLDGKELEVPEDE